jgi:sugar phosphate isomerase/epimerase
MLEELPSDSLRIILDAVNLIAPENAEKTESVIQRAISLLGDRVEILHMKDFVLTPEGKMDACACGLGSMKYETLLSFAKAKDLPMTLENTVPSNAETARKHLEAIAEKLQPKQ